MSVQKVHVKGFPATWSAAELEEHLSDNFLPVKSVKIHKQAGRGSFAFAECVDDDSTAAERLVAATVSNYNAFGIVCSVYREQNRFKVPKFVSRMAAQEQQQQQHPAHSLPFSGPITLVHDSRGANQALDSLELEPLLGFDTETRPQFERGKSANPVALLQLSTRLGAYVFSLRHLQVLPATLARLLALLANPRVVKAGVNVEKDVNSLMLRFPQLVPAGFVRLELLARHAGHQEAGLGNLAAKLLQLELGKSKVVTLSDWECWPLTQLQLTYAGTDAWAGCMIAFKLLAQLSLTVSDLLDSDPNRCLFRLRTADNASSQAVASSSSSSTTKKSTPAAATATTTATPVADNDNRDRDASNEALKRKRRRHAARGRLAQKWADKSDEQLQEIWDLLPAEARDHATALSDRNPQRTFLQRVVDARVFADEQRQQQR
jgi:ribonuclease D